MFCSLSGCTKRPLGLVRRSCPYHDLTNFFLFRVVLYWKQSRSQCHIYCRNRREPIHTEIQKPCHLEQARRPWTASTFSAVKPIKVPNVAADSSVVHCSLRLESKIPPPKMRSSLHNLQGPLDSPWVSPFPFLNQIMDALFHWKSTEYKIAVNVEFSQEKRRVHSFRVKKKKKEKHLDSPAILPVHYTAPTLFFQHFTLIFLIALNDR